MVDPIEEGAVTDARNVNWANGQSNITGPSGADIVSERCLVSSTSAAGTRIVNTAAGNGAMTDGNVMFFNTTVCTSFYVVQQYECSTAANRWCFQPNLHPKWSQNNGSGNEFTSVTASMSQGGLFIPPGDVTTAFNYQQPVPLYTADKPFAPSTIINYIQTTFTVDTTNFGAGKCFTVYSDDQGSYLGWMINQTLSGSAATSYQVCRAA